MIRDDRRRDEAGELEPAVAVRCAHHRNLYALIAQASDAPRPFSFNRGSPFELKAQLAKEINRLAQVLDDDSYVVHPFERHVSNLHWCRPIAFILGGTRWTFRTFPFARGWERLKSSSDFHGLETNLRANAPILGGL